MCGSIVASRSQRRKMKSSRVWRGYQKRKGGLALEVGVSGCGEEQKKWRWRDRGKDLNQRQLNTEWKKERERDKDRERGWERWKEYYVGGGVGVDQGIGMVGRVGVEGCATCPFSGLAHVVAKPPSFLLFITKAGITVTPLSLLCVCVCVWGCEWDWETGSVQVFILYLCWAVKSKVNMDWCCWMFLSHCFVFLTTCKETKQVRSWDTWLSNKTMWGNQGKSKKAISKNDIMAAVLQRVLHSLTHHMTCTHSASLQEDVLTNLNIILWALFTFNLLFVQLLFNQCILKPLDCSTKTSPFSLSARLWSSFWAHRVLVS